MDDHGPGFCKKCLQLQRPCENYPVGKITEQSTRKRKVIEKPIKTKSAPKREEENITETQTKRDSDGVLPSKEEQSNEVLGRNEDNSDRRSEQRKDKSGRRGTDNASNGRIHSKLADGNKREEVNLRNYKNSQIWDQVLTESPKIARVRRILLQRNDSTVLGELHEVVRSPSPRPFKMMES
jgi:hypothetical protein